MSTLAGYLLLPVKVHFEFNGFPDLGKSEMISLSLFLGTILFRVPKKESFSPILSVVLLTLFLFSPAFTAFFNSDSITSSKLYLVGMSFYDAIGLIIANFLVVMPFIIAMSLFDTMKKIEFILKILISSMIFYSVLILFEIRFSPQLHTWIYGFFPHAFDQQMREGGFRSVVFLGHGLIVAIFLSMALVGAIGFARHNKLIGVLNAKGAVIAIFVILLLQKSLAALTLACLCGLAVATLSRRKQLMLAAIFAAIILAYPVFRSSSLFPRQTITQMAGDVSAERSGSLIFRLENEDKLLARGSERPFFGWGTWGRNRVFDLESGKDTSVTDGTWIIQVGSFGWIGYLSMFGLLTYPIFHLAAQFRRNRRSPPWQVVTLAFVLIVNLLDLLPNSSLTTFTWLLAGALAGYKPGPSDRSHGKRQLLLNEAFAQKTEQK